MTTDPTSRGVIEVAKLYHGGGCNDAPGALVNLLRTASQGDLKLRVRAAPDMIGIGDDSLFRYHMVFMHGRRDFRLTPAERTRLNDYLQRGGTLFADAICASKPFATALQRELEAAIPGHTFERIPDDDPLFTTAYGGYDIRKVTLREPATTDANQPVAARVQTSRAAARRHLDRRPLGRDLLTVRHQLRTRGTRSTRLPRVYSPRRRPHRPQRAALFAEPVTWSKSLIACGVVASPTKSAC